MDFENKYVDELIEIRKEARQNKDWKLCDEIRNYLDIKLVFIFDTKAGQEIYYLFEEYFKNKENKEKEQKVSTEDARVLIEIVERLQANVVE